MIRIDKYTIRYRDKHNPFTVYKDVETTDKEGNTVVKTKAVAYLNNLHTALQSVYNKLQAESDIVGTEVELDLKEAIELIKEQTTQFKAMISIEKEENL